jgi:dTDP-4-amino-4,6-dideoxygalactose transaminase
LENSANVVAALNCNLNEISAAIGREQLKKLPGIVERRRRFVNLLMEKGLKDLKSIDIPALLPGAFHSYWWWRLGVNSDAITCSKEDFLKAVQAEGVALALCYRAAIPHKFEWFKNRSVFGSSKLPWSSSSYKGDAEREFPCPNAEAVMDECFNLTIFESWSEKEAELIVEAFRKVEGVYLK